MKREIPKMICVSPNTPSREYTAPALEKIPMERQNTKTQSRESLRLRGIFSFAGVEA